MVYVEAGHLPVYIIQPLHQYYKKQCGITTPKTNWQLVGTGEVAQTES